MCSNIWRELVPHLYLFGEQPGSIKPPPWVTPVIDWQRTTKRVLRDLAAFEDD